MSEIPYCLKCGEKMTLVAAGWYCMKDDILIDKNTLLPIGGAPPKYYVKEELIGKEIFDSRVRRVGSVKDIAYSKEGKVALVTNQQRKQPIIPFDFVDQIGDIITLKSSWREPSEPNKVCPACGVRNPSYATRYCVSCGAKFE